MHGVHGVRRASIAVGASLGRVGPEELWEPTAVLGYEELTHRRGRRPDHPIANRRHTANSLTVLPHRHHISLDLRLMGKGYLGGRVWVRVTAPRPL